MRKPTGGIGSLASKGVLNGVVGSCSIAMLPGAVLEAKDNRGAVGEPDLHL